MTKRFTRDDLEKFHEYDIFVPSRTIYMGSMETSLDMSAMSESGVDAMMVDRFLKNLHFLENQSDQPIIIIMDNVGGDWYHGMAIYDAIRGSRCHITIKGYGNVMSMGSVILQAADERILLPNTTVMIHDGYEGFDGTPKSFEAWGRQSKKVRERMYAIYAERSARPVKFWEEKCSVDLFLTADEAIILGLADSVQLPPERPQDDETTS